VLDANNGTLSSAGKHISLTPKDCALLYHLAANAGRLISHAELMRVVWPDTAVGPDVLKVRVAKLRRLLADDTSTPRFIVNHHGEGYRFLPQPEARRERGPIGRTDGSQLCVVGRAREMDVLDAALDDASRGRRRIVFVTGAAGIGKTTLIDGFVERVAGSVWIGRGQCVEHYGGGEPYLPFMEALSRLGRQDAGGTLKRALRRYAPSWLLQLPTLIDPAEREDLQRHVPEPNRQRMLRELAEALEALDADPNDANAPLLLILEDLHWADTSTLDLLQIVGRRRESARLLVIGSCRPSEVSPTSASLRRVVYEMSANGAAIELALAPLGQDDVTQYLDARFPENVFPRQLSELLHRRTGGHPLFLSDIVCDLRARNVILRADPGWVFGGELVTINEMMPPSVHQLLARQRDELTTNDRRVLEAASVSGVEFSVASLTAALNVASSMVEERCSELVRQRFLQTAGTENWPDGTQSIRFAFPHVLHREFWQSGVSQSQAEQWHLRIANLKNAAYGDRAPEIAPELAAHFEHGRDYARAIHYYEHAAALAMRRAANALARSHLVRALELVPNLEETPDRARLELRLRVTLGTAWAIDGFGSEEAAAEFGRAHNIYRQTGKTPELLDSVFGLTRYFWIRGELWRARELADQMQAMARQDGDPVRRLAACVGRGTVLVTQGAFSEAVDTLAEGLELARLHWREQLVGLYAGDLRIICAGTLANTLQMAGFPDRAACYMDEVNHWSDERHPLATAGALYGASVFYQLRREHGPALECAESLKRLADRYQLAQYQIYANVHLGWALAANGRHEEGTGLLEAAVETLRLVGARMYLPLALALLADSHLGASRIDEAGVALDDALSTAASTGVGMYLAELHRLDGERELRRSNATAAEASFSRAISIARQQQARLWELRAATSLGQLARAVGHQEEARATVAHVYESFSEGFDTVDLQAARVFLTG
jgi:tetratricopeptide (TPR) repeat protein